MRNLARAGAVAFAAVTAVSGALVAPAQAGDTSTTVTFEVTGQGLTISAPVSASLGSFTVDSDAASGNLGEVTVTDRRGLLAAGWSATVSTTDFTTGSGSPAETIPAERVQYTSGLPTSTTGVSLNLGTGPLNALLGGNPLPVFTTTALGNNSATWNPTLSVPLDNPVAGTYTGTVTHSVS